jgi:hypothetical protein
MAGRITNPSCIGTGACFRAGTRDGQSLVFKPRSTHALSKDASKEDRKPLSLAKLARPRKKCRKPVVVQLAGDFPLFGG